MIFHENRLLADDPHEISYLPFCRKLGKMSQNLSSAVVVIGALMVKVKSKLHYVNQHCELHMLRDFLCCLIIYNFS